MPFCQDICLSSARSAEEECEISGGIHIARQKHRYKQQRHHYLAFLFALVAALSIFLLVIRETQGTGVSPDSSGTVPESSPSSEAIEETAVYVNGESVVRSTALNVPEELENIILNFLDTQFAALATLKSADITGFFDLSNAESYANAMINQTSLDYLIQLRAMQPNDLTMTDYHFGITYTDLTYSDNGDIEITLLEDNQVQFSFLNGLESCSTGIEHTFIFTKSTSGYKLISHEKMEDVYALISDSYFSAAEGNHSQSDLSDFQNIDTVLTAVESDLLEDAKENLSSIAKQLQNYTENPENYATPDIDWEYDYDREAAVTYAMEWVDEAAVIRNDAFESYDDLGGNCNNFISQCIFAGGIPMDNFGTSGLQWKWYGDAISFSQNKSGRSSSWAGVNEFFEYCTYNEGYGLVAWTGDNIFSAQIGDVLQFGVQGTWKHSVIITEIVYDSLGNPVDFLINSNTTDRINYPASAYAYSDIRAIRILGYNL